MGRILCPCSSWCQNLDQGVGVEITGTGCKLSDPNSCLRSQVFLKALWKIITISQDMDRGADPTLSQRSTRDPFYQSTGSLRAAGVGRVGLGTLCDLENGVPPS